MTTDHERISKASLDTLSALATYRFQRRAGRNWLVGAKRVSNTTIAGLERKELVREIAVGGNPVLVLTDRGKALLSRKR